VQPPVDDDARFRPPDDDARFRPPDDDARFRPPGMAAPDEGPRAPEGNPGRAKRIRVSILLGVLLVVGLAYLRIYLQENWTPDWDQSQLVSVQILVPPNLDEDEEALLEQLDSFSFADEGIPSITALDDWFSAEQKRYGVATSSPPVLFSVVPSKAMRSDPVAPPKGDEPFSERYSKTNAFLDFYTSHRTASPATNTIYVIFYRSATHPEFRKIHSVADRRSRSGFVFAALDDAGAEAAVINLGHELLHLFGASDKYEGKQCAFPAGYAEPFRQPLHPQRFAEVMAQGIPNGPGQSETMIRTFDEARIGVETAAEIGWIDEERRARYYAGDVSAGPVLEEED
tara:strand:+ start:397 stop:1422 length:1026 start_codon:yes stop_codon:yes gene_type:complete